MLQATNVIGSKLRSTTVHHLHTNVNPCSHVVRFVRWTNVLFAHTFCLTHVREKLQKALVDLLLRLDQSTRSTLESFVTDESKCLCHFEARLYCLL